MPSRSPLAVLAHAAAHASGITRRRGPGDGGLRILMLHGVGVGGLPLASLRRLLRWVRRHREPVTLHEVARRLEDPARCIGREVALTFDDGLANNARHAAPALAAAGVPATFFVCAERIARGRWLWNHEARARLRRLAPGARDGLARDLGAPAAAVEAFVAWMKGLGSGERARVEEALRASTPRFEATAAEREAYDMMDADQLRALDPRWIDVGNHTRSHPILTTLSEAAIAEEVAGGRADLEDLLQREVPWFCYPNGSEDERVRAVVRRHHRHAVTTAPGLARPGADALGLPRIGATASLAETTWRMLRP